MSDYDNWLAWPYEHQDVDEDAEETAAPPRFQIGDRVTWQGQEGMCFGTIKRQYKPDNCDHYVLILDIGDDTEFPHGEQDVELASPHMEPCPECDGTGRLQISLEGQAIPCSNCGGMGGIEVIE